MAIALSFTSINHDIAQQAAQLRLRYNITLLDAYQVAVDELEL